ncbi:MAG: hypothetical protein BWZ10_03333 [candidate division BRC1 bacterium ADurb.BinA364]|nr:MAG: hypothetical protein BWZ10_03333 [candidate division BRC1 bacterium ADurb.BinA364]
MDSKEDIAKIQDWIAELTAWAAGGAPPAGGATALPMERGGGGPIYPERERRFGAIVVFFARNQTEALLRTVEEDLPAVKKQLFEWLPTLESPDPLFIVLSSGAGGGWAVNAYLPKETGVISLSREGVISVFAHELAHTMAGPANARGEAAGRSPLHNQGEAHAGWWQGKINALMGGKSKEPNRLFEFDKNGDALDLAAPEGENLRQWGKGKDWTKIWWVWQTLEDRYGPAWYPRWKWVQHTRWQDDPQRALSWDETIEDMSIAAGEDLFPFFASIGTTLGKTRMGRIEFQGRTVELPPAKIEIRPCGEPNLGAIGDYLAGLKTD